MEYAPLIDLWSRVLARASHAHGCSRSVDAQTHDCPCGFVALHERAQARIAEWEQDEKTLIELANKPGGTDWGG